MKRWFFVLGCILLLAGTVQAQDAAKKEKPRAGDANLITTEEISQGDFRSALDAVQALRPSMLRHRGMTLRKDGTCDRMATMAADPQETIIAYVDDKRLGDVTCLSGILAAMVREIRFINSREATARLGTGNANGAIIVYTKK